MKLCINCKHYREDTVCVSPQIDNLVHPVTGEKITLQYKSCDFFRRTWYACFDGKWYEDKVAEPIIPEGWELMGDNEVIEEGDRFYDQLNTEWLDCESTIGMTPTQVRKILPVRGKNRVFIRRVELKQSQSTLANCPDGHEPCICSTRRAYAVFCITDCLWRGGERVTKEEAIEAWNSVMQK